MQQTGHRRHSRVTTIGRLGRDQAETKARVQTKQRLSSLRVPSSYRHYEDFFFSYFPLLESHIERLKGQIEQALQASSPSKSIQENIAEVFACTRRTTRASRFSFICTQFVTSFKLTLVNLANTMRLSSPFWSCFVASKSVVSRPVASRQFIGLLHSALKLFNNKQSNNL